MFITSLIEQYLCFKWYFLSKIGEILKLERISNWMAQIASNYLEALRNDHFVLHVNMQNKIASSNQNGMKCILFDAVLSSKPKAAQAHLAAATKQWHTQHGQAFPRLARKQFDPQFYPVPVVSNEFTSKRSATNICCKMEKDLPQGLEDDQDRKSVV